MPRLAISRGVGKVQSAVGHMGERKEEMHGGGGGGGRKLGFTARGDKGEIEVARRKPAQDW